MAPGVLRHLRQVPGGRAVRGQGPEHHGHNMPGVRDMFARALGHIYLVQTPGLVHWKYTKSELFQARKKATLREALKNKPIRLISRD